MLSDMFMAVYLRFSPEPTCIVYRADATLPPGSTEARILYGDPYEGQVILPILFVLHYFYMCYLFFCVISIIQNVSSSYYIYTCTEFDR